MWKKSFPNPAADTLGCSPVIEVLMDDESDEQQNRLRGMFAAVETAYDAEVERTGKHPDITMIHPDLYDFLLRKLIEKGLLGYVVDQPMKYRRSIARRLPRQNIDTDYSVEFRKDTKDDTRR